MDDAVADAEPSGGGRLKLVVAVVAAVAIGVAWFTLPVDRWLLAMVEWIRDAGALGVAIYVGVYVVAAVLFLPGSLVTLAAGFAYGPVWGTVIVFPTATLAATIAFLVGRFFARDWVAKKVEGNARFQAIDNAIGKSGFRIVALLRLSPVFPFNLLNYSLGLTKVRLRDYVLASIGMLPGTALFVYLGSLITSATEIVSGNRPDGGTAQTVLYWGGLGATLLVTVILTRIARRELAKDIGDAKADTEPE